MKEVSIKQRDIPEIFEFEIKETTNETIMKLIDKFPTAILLHKKTNIPLQTIHGELSRLETKGLLKSKSCKIRIGKNTAFHSSRLYERVK